jgi:hypothetical protein
LSRLVAPSAIEFVTVVNAKILFSSTLSMNAIFSSGSSIKFSGPNFAVSLSSFPVKMSIAAAYPKRISRRFRRSLDYVPASGRPMRLACWRVTEGPRTRSSAAFRSGGTESSNPASSSGESRANPTQHRVILTKPDCLLHRRIRLIDAGCGSPQSITRQCETSEQEGRSR